MATSPRDTEVVLACASIGILNHRRELPPVVLGWLFENPKLTMPFLFVNGYFGSGRRLEEDAGKFEVLGRVFLPLGNPCL